MNVEHPVLSEFTALLAVPSPSGREEAVANAIGRRLDQMGTAWSADGAGNITVRLAGRNPEGPLVCYAAHMDEIGMVVTGIAEDGTLKVDRSGGLRPWKLGEGPVTVLGDGEAITGILSMGSTHTAGDGGVTWQDVGIMTGLSRDRLAALGIRAGSTAVPIRSFCGPVAFGDPQDPLVAAWTYDDRLGCAFLLHLLDRLQETGSRPACPTLIGFTVHEEGGGHGAKVLAHRERPEIFISIDGSPIPPGSGLALDGRPATWSKDRLTHYDQGLVRELLASGRAAGTEVQVAVYDSAASDASLVYSTGGAPRVACFGHVRENSHGYEVIRLSVLDHTARTLLHFVENFSG